MTDRELTDAVARWGYRAVRRELLWWRTNSKDPNAREAARLAVERLDRCRAEGPADVV